MTTVSATYRRTAQTWICLVLCFACWRGPVPWVHKHALSDAAGPEFSDHLRREHASDSDEGHSHWHMHVALPWTLFQLPCDEHPVSPEPADPLSTQGAVLTSLELPALSGPPLLTRFLDAADETAADLSRGILHVSRAASDPGGMTFSGSLLLCAPLCAVIGVALV